MLLSELTSIKIGGTAAEFHVPETIEAFARLLAELRDARPFVLGGGCNTLFPDGRFERPVVSTAKLQRVEIDGTSVVAGAGVRIDILIRRAIASGLGGLEGLVGIPGTVGGATAMNAGGHGGCFGDHVAEIGLVSLQDGGLQRVPGPDVPWGYRSWNLEGFAVGWVRLELEPADPDVLRCRAREFILKKSRSQPLSQPSSGCVFKNPGSGSAGALIDAAGLKGERIGGAMVSERHANFIVNDGTQATASDVLALIRRVREKVHATSGVALETEIVLAGASPVGPATALGARAGW